MIIAQAISATDIVRKADEKFNGEKSSYSVMSMTIIRPEWKRTIESRAGLLERICIGIDHCPGKRNWADFS